MSEFEAFTYAVNLIEYDDRFRRAWLPHFEAGHPAEILQFQEELEVKLAQNFRNKFRLDHPALVVHHLQILIEERAGRL